MALILATGVRKFHEYQSLKGNREEKDFVSYYQLEKKFGANKRTIMECWQGYKYCYPKGISTKVPFMLTPLEEEEEEISSATKMTLEAALTPAMGATAESDPATT